MKYPRVWLGLIVFGLCLVVLLMTRWAASAADGLTIGWWSVDGGGGMFSAGSEYSIGGAGGQPDAGIHSGGGYTLRGGFWAGAAPLTPTSTPTATATRTATATATATPTPTATPTATSTVEPICNASPITVIDYTAASPYPSSITISGLGTSVTDVNVFLYGVTHTYPDDLDFLLVGPQGQNLVILSDTGGGLDISGINLTLDDNAASTLPDESVLNSGAFRPANYAPADTFPSPAPAPSGATTLTAFNGTDPNGTWSLYIVDDAVNDAGSLSGGWCLEIIATGSAPSATPTPTRTTTATASSTPTATGLPPTPTATATISLTPTATSTAISPTATATATATATPTATSSLTATPTHTPIPGLCSAPSIAIPDNGVITDTLVIGVTGAIADLDVQIIAAHTWVGDLTFTVHHAGNSVTIIDRPGVPATSYGCDGNDINAILDDFAALPVEDQCAASVPAINGVFQPNNLLNAFNGENLDGTWTLTVLDNVPGDTGALQSWCLLATISGTPPTLTATPTRTATATATASPTATTTDIILTPTATASRTATASVTATATSTATSVVVTPTPTASRTATASVTATATSTATSVVATPTATASRTASATATATTTDLISTPTATASRTATRTATSTVTATYGAPTATASPSVTPATSRTATPTITPPPTITATPATDFRIYLPLVVR